jgi:hypothetical protein
MRRSLALLIPALALAAACTQSPTAATKHPAVRFDGGNYFGSGNVVNSGGDNYYGSGNVVGLDGGSTAGSGSAAGGTNTTLADSVTAGERGGLYYGSGN